jgi:hypothetical protein
LGFLKIKESTPLRQPVHIKQDGLILTREAPMTRRPRNYPAISGYRRLGKRGLAADDPKKPMQTNRRTFMQAFLAGGVLGQGLSLTFTSNLLAMPTGEPIVILAGKASSFLHA